MARNGKIVMTALPPTTGHLRLIEFASCYIASLQEAGRVDVLVHANPAEPMTSMERAAVLHHECRNMANVVIHDLCSDMPEQPEEHPQFWDLWRDLVRSVIGAEPGDIVFASEPYGVPLAAALGCDFVPCDMERKAVGARATAVRKFPIHNFQMLSPWMRVNHRRVVTFFGAECCGKTMISRAVAQSFDSPWLAEWARPYLETVGPECDARKMEIIMRGQYASMVAARQTFDRPLLIQDTDLLSTIGYYRIMGLPEPAQMKRLFSETRADLYILMHDRIPFEPDPLRYGGDKRESTTAFWRDLLVEFGCTFHEMQSDSMYDQMSEATWACRDHFVQNCKWAGYARKGQA